MTVSEKRCQGEHLDRTRCLEPAKCLPVAATHKNNTVRMLLVCSAVQALD